mmetsp:Transcript_26179/g.73046  ORF Transcript_26179/g.73046 Transcript_26179/m.73046 type:complete len:98 (-) Transcript_26179:1257-1550(-)
MSKISPGHASKQQEPSSIRMAGMNTATSVVDQSATNQYGSSGTGGLHGTTTHSFLFHPPSSGSSSSSSSSARRRPFFLIHHDEVFEHRNNKCRKKRE